MFIEKGIISTSSSRVRIRSFSSLQLSAVVNTQNHPKRALDMVPTFLDRIATTGGEVPSSGQTQIYGPMGPATRGCIPNSTRSFWKS